ncbi:MAG TPA: nitroreductase family protein [Spirochaetia bacterium]|nr:nitroreductase family protein [Spirochaetia bacterium]
MDQKLSILFARRSIRKYTSAPIGAADVRSILEAGMAAPSANDRQPWQIVAVQDRTMLRELADAHPYGRMLADAPLGIAVCGDPSVSTWWEVDCAAATENMLVAAAGLGLGGVWLGVHGDAERERSIRKVLGVPDRIGILSLIAIGHPAEHKEPRTQFDPSKVHTDRW